MLPFKHYPKVFSNTNLFYKILEEVTFNQDSFFNNGTWCKELRGTSWMSDNLSTTLEYSGKIMNPNNLSPTISYIRNHLLDTFGIYFDSVLANYYPNGTSAMRFHSDPLANKWDTNFVIVSFGSTRKLVFREIKDYQTKYYIQFEDGDCVHMFDKCQDLYQHSIKKDKHLDKPRISLVFKRLKT